MTTGSATAEIPFLQGKRARSLSPGIDGPWMWQTKAARRLIRHYFEPSKCACSALSVYDALTEIASDEQAEVFEASIDLIARTAGVARRTAGPMLERLGTLGFIGIEKRKFPGTNMDAPSVYTLLACPGHHAPVGNGCTPVGNGCTPVGNERRQRSLPTSEESLKNLPEKSTEETTSSLERADGLGANLSADEIWTHACRLTSKGGDHIRTPLDEHYISAAGAITLHDMEMLTWFCGWQRRAPGRPGFRSPSKLLQAIRGEIVEAKKRAARIDPETWDGFVPHVLAACPSLSSCIAKLTPAWEAQVSRTVIGWWDRYKTGTRWMPQTRAV